jgi:hypothetical protein
MQYDIEVVYPGANRFNGRGEYPLPPNAMLEQVFAWFNAGSGQESQEFVKSRTRSLSKGDFVRLNNQWYQCAPVGWMPVSPDYVAKLEEDVKNTPGYTKDKAWFVLQDIMFKNPPAWES